MVRFYINFSRKLCFQSDSAPSFFHLVYISPCPNQGRRIMCKLCPSVAIITSKADSLKNFLLRTIFSQELCEKWSNLSSVGTLKCAGHNPKFALTEQSLQCQHFLFLSYIYSHGKNSRGKVINLRNNCGISGASHCPRLLL
jgi:hypothetical protein